MHGKGWSSRELRSSCLNETNDDHCIVFSRPRFRDVASSSGRAWTWLDPHSQRVLSLKRASNKATTRWRWRWRWRSRREILESIVVFWPGRHQASVCCLPFAVCRLPFAVCELISLAIIILETPIKSADYRSQVSCGGCSQKARQSFLAYNRQTRFKNVIVGFLGTHLRCYYLIYLLFSSLIESTLISHLSSPSQLLPLFQQRLFSHSPIMELASLLNWRSTSACLKAASTKKTDVIR